MELKPGARATEGDLIDYCHHRLAGYECPRTVAFVDRLPRSDSGKIYKRRLRGHFRRSSR